MASEAVVGPGGDHPRRRPGWVLDLAPGLLFVAALALYAVRLADPPRYIYDEVYHAFTAGEIVRGNEEALVWWTKPGRPGVGYTWNHPPAGILLIAGGVAVWGDHAYGWRFASAVFGALGIVLAFLLARSLAGDRRVALLAAILLMLDGLYFVQSRTAMLDTFGVAFMLGAFLALHRWLLKPPGRARGPLLALGLGIGLAVATKWNAVYAATLIGLVVIARMVALGAVARGHAGLASVAGLGNAPDPAASAREGLRAHLAWVPVALLLVPAAVYLAAYIPFFAAGNSFGQFLEQQVQIYRYHAGLDATHRYQSAWWQWPLALRPVWYHAGYTMQGVANVYANVNPLLAWGMLPAVAWLAARWWRERRAAAVVVLLGFFGQWLPWALVPRIAFAYHFLPAVPFGCLAIAVWIAAQVRRGGWPRFVALAWLAAIVAAFVWFYPIWSGVPLTPEAFERRLWLPSWR